MKKCRRSLRGLVLGGSALLLAGWLSNDARAAIPDNLLVNSGFEKNTGSNSVPEGWAREVDPVMNPVMRGPFALVKDPHLAATNNEWAVQMETEEWNYLRPQRLMQEVTLPAKTTRCTATAYAKGNGLFTLVFQFRKAGKPLSEEKMDGGFGEYSLPRETFDIYALGAEYRQYTFQADVPEGADSVLLKVGNTVDTFGRVNVFGRLVLDDVTLIAESGPKVEPAKPSRGALGTTMPVSTERLVDIAPLCRISMTPPSLNNDALVDGSPATGPGLVRGPERGVITKIVLPKAVPITRLAIYLAGNVDSYEVRADLNGDGICETNLDLAVGMKGQTGWVVYGLTDPFTTNAVSVIQIQGIKGGLWGFRGSGHFINEIQVWVAEDAATGPEFARASDYRDDLKPPAETPALAFTPVEFPLKKGPHKFRKMVCADTWMWGQTTEKVKKADFLKSKGFLDNVAIAKDMGVDTIFIDLTNASCENKMPWPSKVCNGMTNNPMKELIGALHECGFKVVLETLHNFTPFEPIKWHYPCEETIRYPFMKQYPSILFGTHVRDNWLTIYREMLFDCGADGVCLGSDEFYYRGTFLRILPKDDPARQAYKERFKEEIPADMADTLAYRRWITLRHEALGDLYGYWSKTLKKEKSNVYLCSVFMQPIDNSNLYGQGVPIEVLGARGGVDEMGSDYMGPYDLRLLAAANGWRKTEQLFSGNMYSGFKEPEINLYGPAMWMLMYGGGSCNYWRFYQIIINNSASAVKHGYEMVDDLMALGVWDAKPPQDITVVLSRASLDWWEVKASHGQLADANTDRAVEARRGWASDQLIVGSVLMNNGYPFDALYLDRPKELDGLTKSKLIIMPFAYSVSDEAAAKVKAAVKKGAKLVLVGRMGETDEWGEPRSVPAFKELVDSGKAVLVTDDVYAVGGDRAFMRKMRKIIDDALGEDNPLKAELYAQPMNVTLISKGAKEKFVFILNQGGAAPVDLSVGLPKGSYQVMMRDDLKWSKASLGGKNVFTQDMLKKFRVNMPKQQGRVLYIREAK